MNSTAIIKSSPEGQHVIAGMTVQMRMIKLLISQGFSRIIVERPDLPDLDREDAAPLSDLLVIAANERTAQVQYAAPEDISQSHGDIIAKDSYILHPDVLKGFLNARHTQLIGSDHDVVLTKAVSKPDQHEAFPYQNWNVVRVQSNQLKYAKKQLFRYLCKEGDGLVSRHINRPISTFISRYLVDLNVTPIHCTALTVLCAVIMVAALIYAPVIGIFWGCLMFQVASVVDGLDGEIARVQFTATARGAKLDTGIDMATNILFTVGVSYALWQIHGEDFLALGLIAISLAVLGV
ncbi:MAG: CDP-alcohol phosphatidyltransferase family protein, partial [Pseudomonadota bacterium]